jgi:hypothetical protein
MGLGLPPNIVRNGVKPPPVERFDPGPPYPGVNCHIVIDGVGYIFANIASYSQESQKNVESENLAPYFGDPQNQLDTQSSDLTMLLPIGQNDFSAGIGATDLEHSPHGYERAENLMWTAQNTLINGPKVNFEPFVSNPNPVDPRGYQEGYFGGTIESSTTALNYFGIGSNLYTRSSGAWYALPARSPISDILGYSGRIIVGYGSNGGDVFYHGTAYAATYQITKLLVVNGSPFVMSADGRIYSGFLYAPPAPTITSETGADVSVSHWAYALQFVITMPDATKVATGLGLLAFATKLANTELVLNIPNRGYKGGPVLRRLYRTKTNDLNVFYLIADETVLGSNATRFVDTFTDAGITGNPVYDWTTINNTGLVILIAGTTDHNMQFPDTNPIWLPEKLVAPIVGDRINNAKIFHDSQGNQGVAIGTTSGLFIWDGVSVDFQSIIQSYYHPLNFRYMGVNHGWVYYTMMGHMVYQWAPDKQQILQGPWLTQFTTVNEIRLTTLSSYLAISVTGITKYEPGVNSCIVYLFDGAKFVWSHRWTANNYNDVTPVLGGLANENTLAIWKGVNSGGISLISMDPSYSSYETNNVLFRSAASDGDLPRLRKQVHAVMVRYLQLTPQPSHIIALDSVVGDDHITLDSTVGFAIGNWIKITGVSLTQNEWRKISNIVGNIVYLSHTLGNALQYPHLFGAKVTKCAAIVKLRNVFTDTLDTQDIEVGGPAESGELFSYCRLPQPVYTYTDGIEISWNTGTVMELIGWAMLTGLNPAWNGQADFYIRLEDYVKLPNNLYDNALASERSEQLKIAYNKGTVEVIDPLGARRIMRFQRLNFAYEEPKQRHSDNEHMQATASIKLIDQMAELSKQSELVLNIRSQ